MSRPSLHPRRPHNLRTTEDTGATKEMAAEKMLINRPETARRLKVRELERLVRLLLVMNHRLHRSVIALGVYHELTPAQIAERLGIGEARARDILAAADRRLKNHEACINRDAILARQASAPAPLPNGGEHA